MEERQHLLRVILRRTEKENRVQCLLSSNRKTSGRLPQLSAAYISATVLFYVLYYETPTFHVGAYILWTEKILYRRRSFLNLEYFMSADISWTPTFHGRRHFMGADISWARTF